MILRFVLALLLSVVSIPSASACAMQTSLTGQDSIVSNAEDSGCHEMAQGNSPNQEPDCVDCLDHCPLLAQAALLLADSLHFASVSHSSPNLPFGIALKSRGEKLFKPPTQTPTPIFRISG